MGKGSQSSSSWCCGGLTTHNLHSIQVAISVCNLFFVLLIIIFLVTGTITLKQEADRYVTAMNLTPEKTGVAMEQTLGIVSNVHTVTENMVPISNVTKDYMTSNKTTVDNSTMAEATTGLLLKFGEANWTSLVGNASAALGSASLLNFTVVSQFVKQLTEPQFQSTVKEQVVHALSSFDFAASGAGNFFQTLKNGIMAQNTKDH